MEPGRQFTKTPGPISMGPRPASAHGAWKHGSRLQWGRCGDCIS